VKLLGYAKNPFAILSRADFYVSASHCEGFPNALAEAMASGLPAISTDCPSGPAEILAGVETTATRDVLRAEYGVLVPVHDRQALASALGIMSDAQLRTHYARKAVLRMQDFRIDTIAARYWSAFRHVLGDRIAITTRLAPLQADDLEQA
jgi:glycosyltransferase involved in cell wall biosynthesis